MTATVVPLHADDTAARYPRVRDGATFIEAGAAPDPIWGEAEQPLAAKGEGTMICGPPGVGKTTLVQQVMRARLGAIDTVLGLPVVPGERKVLYLAMDRPHQAARSLARMVTSDSERQLLREQLVVQEGPPPFDVVRHPEALAEMVVAFNADTLVIDSYKDLAAGLAKDEVGASINIAIQHVVAAGAEVFGLHHQRKAQGDNKKPNTLADVYGSTWLTSGLGSVILLWGNPGDLLVEFDHLKPPAEAVGPFSIRHDHRHGISTIADQVDLEQLLANTPAGLSAHDAAGMIFASANPDRNQVEKARRKLERLVEKDVADKIKGDSLRDPTLYILRLPRQATGGKYRVKRVKQRVKNPTHLSRTSPSRHNKPSRTLHGLHAPPKTVPPPL